VSEKFLKDHEPVLMYLAISVLRAALETPGAVDADVRDALQALVKTYRTMQSGLIYQSRPDNMLAGAIVERVTASIEEIRKAMSERTGMQSIRDVDVLGVLVFLERMEIQQNNGRRLGRAFIDFLLTYFPPPASDDSGSGLIV
jgi:hypothetical protein